MRRLVIASLALPMAMLLAVGPAAADTTPGGSGTNFGTFASSCSTSSGRQTCTDTSVSVSPNESGDAYSTCLDVYSYSISSNGRFTFIAEQFGCVDATNVTISSDYSVTLDPTDISVATCKAHQRQCSGSTLVTVSADASPIGDVSTTTTRSTTKAGSCTVKTTIDRDLRRPVRVDDRRRHHAGRLRLPRHPRVDDHRALQVAPPDGSPMGVARPGRRLPSP